MKTIRNTDQIATFSLKPEERILIVTEENYKLICSARKIIGELIKNVYINEGDWEADSRFSTDVLNQALEFLKATEIAK